MYNSDGFDESGESREKIIAAEKRERKELIMKQFAFRRSVSKEDKVSLLQIHFFYIFISIFHSLLDKARKH